MKKLIAVLLAGGAVLSTAQAQTVQPASRFYLGLGLATADHSYSVDNIKVTSHDGYSGNVKFFGGYEVDPIFAVEIGYTDYRNAGFDYFAPGVASGHGTSDGNSYYLAAKAQYPINNQFLAYAKVGPERSRRNLKEVGFFNQGESETHVYVSLGVQYNVTPAIGLLAEYERYGKSKDFGAKADSWTIAARYSF